MKIRIQGNSIRLRLSQPELYTFAENGIVTDSIQFGSTPEETLHYVLEKSSVHEIGAAYGANQIKVLVPSAQAVAWCETEMVGLEHNMPVGNDVSLKILIEKDFQCLTARPGEDESDNFPNPKGIC